MASRYPAIKVVDYCFSPITIFHDGVDYVVPCGKCDGCLLHRANIWSTRVANEIDYTPYSIFVTFTYNNYYLPTLKLVDSVWTSKHSDNIRFDGVKDVFRQDDVFIPSLSDKQLVSCPTGLHDGLIGYSSKRDFQLYLKSLRKDINSVFYGKERKFRSLRYYAVSEYGPTFHRPHIHAIFFVQDKEVSEYLVEYALFSFWQMCDKVLFNKYTKYCDRGTANYVTNYVTGFSDLPALLREKSVKPFRLSSKGFAVGFNSFNPDEVQKSLYRGNLEYVKPLKKLGAKDVFRYPKDYLISQFPKCYRFSRLDFQRLCEVYGCLYFAYRRYPKTFDSVSKRFRKVLHSSDYTAARKCLSFCLENHSIPFVYVSKLVDIYFRLDMYNLKDFYIQQEKFMSAGDWISALHMYSNFGLRLKNKFYSGSFYDGDYIDCFLSSFGISYKDLDSSSIKALIDYQPTYRKSYMASVADIIQDCKKVSKFNDTFGRSPHIV